MADKQYKRQLIFHSNAYPDLRIYRMKRLDISCLNQDIHRFKDLQDEEIKYFLSESGYPGFKDLQDEEIKYLLSESGYPPI